MIAELLAANIESSQPTIGFLTNLVDRIIVARIKESMSNDSAAPAPSAASAAGSTRSFDGSGAQAAKRAREATPTKRTFEIEFFDSKSDFYAIKNKDDQRLRDKNYKFASEKPLEYACLIIIDWLEKSSTDFNVSRPGFETFFAPHLNARNYFSAEYGRTSSDLLDQLHDHLEELDPAEKHEYFVSRLTRELDCLFDPDSYSEVDPRLPNDFL